jgi:hypothetical protein
MTDLTRKDFLRGSASLAAALAAPSVAGAAVCKGRAPGMAPMAIGPAGVPELEPIIRLYPAKAVQRSGEVRFGVAEIGVMLPFMGDGEAVWTVNVPEPGRYRIALCYSTTHDGTAVTISANGQDIPFAAPLTDGYYYPDPRGPVTDPGDPDSDGFWRLRGYYLFERRAVPGEVTLVRGVNVVKFKVTAPKGPEAFRLRSIELTPVDKVARVAADAARAKAARANTDWFAHAGYGMWFHFLDLTTPPKGSRKPYKEAVAALDVKALARMVDDCGAKYLIFTVNHGNPTCPAPIRAWEKLHPGWTTERDLIGDLSDALGQHGIRLMLYQNCPGTGMLLQQPGGALDVPAFSEADYARQLVSVFEEFGARYGNKIAGWWLDSWFQTMEAYPNLPNEAIYRAIKSGSRETLVSVNHWALPTEVQWQDYWCGEITDLPAKPFGSRYLNRGPGVGLQAHAAIRLDDPWFHISENTPIQAPRYTAQQLADYVRSCQHDQAPVTFGVGLYQDGTIGPQSYDVLRQLRGMIRGGGKPA